MEVLSREDHHGELSEFSTWRDTLGVGRASLGKSIPIEQPPCQPTAGAGQLTKRAAGCGADTMGIDKAQRHILDTATEETPRRLTLRQRLLSSRQGRVV